MSVARLDFDDGTVLIDDSDCDTTVEKDVYGGPCILHDMFVKNPNDAFAYVHFFDDENPTLGTTEAEEKVRVEKNSTNTLNEGYVHIPINPPNGLAFDTALSFAGSTAAAGTGDPAVSMEVSLRLKPAS